MRWYKRLFWKVFISIWLVSVLLLLVSLLIISSISERDRMDELLSAKAHGYVELMVERYEARGFRPLRLPPPPKRDERRYFSHDHDHDYDDDDHGYRDRSNWRRDRWLEIASRVRITDLDKGKPVVLLRRFNPHSERLIKYDFSSNSGRLYKVELDLKWTQSRFWDLLKKVLSFQVIVLIFVSAIAALLVSAIIVRPLNRLREHVQAIHQGELDSRTDQKLSRRGDELGELAREFDRMADYVQQTLNCHQRLMQDVSHELRAPLARLQAAAGLAEQKLGSEDRIVARIMRECDYLDRLIGEILSLSKLEQMDCTGDNVALEVVLNDLVEDYRFANPERKFNLQLNSRKTIQLNRKLLERAIGNVLGNACKYTVESQPIDLLLSCDINRCLITIRDHGSGVSEEQLEQLCDPFFRADTQQDGYGLGLSIVKRAVVLMGGELELSNHSEGGLQVVISLPC